jgi:preprotein translocase subunit SecE
MARDRQRAKQRQAQRRAQRQSAERARTPGAPRPGTEAGGDGQVAPDEAVPAGDGAGSRGFEADRGGTVPAEVGVETGADLAAAAPPEAAGRSDTVVETPPPPLAADAEADPEAAASKATVGDATEERARAGRHGKVVAFLIAVWAELQRVQWPNRRQLTSLTGIVLGFVVIMGAYLGALDWIFSQLVQLVI